MDLLHLHAAAPAAAALRVQADHLQPEVAAVQAAAQVLLQEDLAHQAVVQDQLAAVQAVTPDQPAVAQAVVQAPLAALDQPAVVQAAAQVLLAALDLLAEVLQKAQVAVAPEEETKYNTKPPFCLQTL